MEGILKAGRVHEILMDCLFKENEPHDRYIKAVGLTRAVGLNPERVEKHQEEIKNMLNELPDTFKNESGDSFLNMAFDRNGVHCMEHPTMEELVMLGIASGWCGYTIEPRELWQVLPGGVPYISINTTRANVEVTDDGE